MRPGLVALLLLIAAPASAATPPPLTAEGWGKLKVGMAERDAIRRFGLKNLDPEGDVTGPECRQYGMPSQPQLDIMTEDGRVTRISLYRKGPILTDRGLGVGASESEVRKAYGASLKSEPHHYEGPPARYLTWRPAPRRLGVRFETNARRKVTAIHVGGASIAYAEGCL